MLTAIRLHESAPLLVFKALVAEELRDDTAAITCSLFSGPPRRPAPDDPDLLAADRTITLPLHDRLCRCMESILNRVILRETLAAREAGISPGIETHDDMPIGDIFAAMERIPLSVFQTRLGDAPEMTVYLVRTQEMNDYVMAGLAQFVRKPAP